MADGQDEFSIQEPLGREYGKQLIHVKTDKPLAQDTVLIGPHGEIPSQQEGNALWFITDPLAPQATLSYQLSSSKKTPAPKSPLKIERGSDFVEIDTGAGVAARFPLGKGSKPTPPLLGVNFGSGWSPASDWRNDKPIASWTSELLASGPVFAKVRTTYQFADQTYASLTATMIVGDTTIRWRMAVSGDYPDTKLELKLPAMPNVAQVSLPKGYGQWAKADKIARTTNAPEGFIQLSPNTSILSLFPDRPSHIIFRQGEHSIELQSSAPGDWVFPGPPQTYDGQTQWSLPMIEAMWEGWRTRGIPIMYGSKGEITLLIDCAKGVREWNISKGSPKVGLGLETARGMTLAWKESTPHPLLFLDAHQWDKASENSSSKQPRREWAALAFEQPDKASEKLREQLALLGSFDLMRYGIATVALYDAVIDHPDLKPADRKLFRAQMAYLAYLLADPMCWSSERGYGSGNPNMHVSYILTLGVAACALRDHPKAKEWMDYASAWFDHWLATEVGPGGEWIPEGSHYSNVSLEAMMSFAIASQRAGYRDFSQDSRFKKLVRFFAKIHTPPDPEHNDFRATPNYGRGTSGEQLATLGLAAKFFANSDPQLSAELQWLWAQAGYPTKIGDYRLGGLTPYYLDQQLPQAAPNWDSEQFPNLGAIFRAGFNTPYESYVNLLAGVDSERNLDVWTPSVTDIAQWFARGKPLSTCFVLLTGTRDRHTLLSEGAQLARNYQPGNKSLPFGYYSTTDFSAFTALPGLDYARTSRTNTKPDNRAWLPPDLPAYPTLKAAQGQELTVTRQIAFLKGKEPKEPAYLVIRDTTEGGEPTTWQFWTLTKGVTDGGQSAELGETIQPARALPQGDRYSASGQFDVDIEYYIAAPANTPRHTLRYGGQVQYQKRTQYQDLLHLQLPQDGSYFLALYPRLPGEATPQFTKDRQERIIRIDHPSGGTDYVFLNKDETEASLDDVSFHGSVGVAKLRGNNRELVLGGEGEINLDASGSVAGRLRIKADYAASLRLEDGRLYINTPENCPGGVLEGAAPGEWSRVKAPVGPASFQDDLSITLPSGAIELIYEPK